LDWIPEFWILDFRFWIGFLNFGFWIAGVGDDGAEWAEYDWGTAVDSGGVGR
jgi:hypothetical protein